MSLSISSFNYAQLEKRRPAIFWTVAGETFRNRPTSSGIIAHRAKPEISRPNVDGVLWRYRSLRNVAFDTWKQAVTKINGPGRTFIIAIPANFLGEASQCCF